MSVVTNTEIIYPLCGQCRKNRNPSNGSAEMILRRLIREHVLKKRFNTDADLTKTRLLEDKLRVRRKLNN